MFPTTTLAIAAAMIAATLALPVEAAAAKTAPAAEAIAVAVDDGRLTLTAPGATLDQVLRAIAARAGFELAIRGDLARPIYATRMRDVPLAEALRRLVGNTSMVMRLEAARDGGAARRVAELRIYAAARRATTERRYETPSAKPRRGEENRERRLSALSRE